jgi:iron complex transport system ATP-binding protein
MKAMTGLHTRGLSLAYDSRLVIEGLELTIETGKITALVGPNGCGKSTLLRGLARLLKPRGGAVYLNFRSIHAMSTKELARELGILPQGPRAPEGLTVYELVAQGRYPHQGFFNQWSVQDEAAARAALDFTRMNDLADRPLDTLSGGQRQRAWIAMTLAQETAILMLDEPTTFLDLAYQVEVLDLLHDLNQHGRTIIMVLHDLNQAGRYADQIVALREGAVVAQGTPQEVITAANVETVFGLAAQVIADPVTGTPMVVPIGRVQPSNGRSPAANARPSQPGHHPGNASDPTKTAG